jgi:hypothetical protein
MRRLGILLLALTAVTVLTAGPALAVTEDFTVRSIGAYDTDATAHITGTAICDGGTGTLSFTNPPGTPYAFSSLEPTLIVCDGTSHDWGNTLVGGPFVLNGAYLVRGTLVADGHSVTKTYKVSLR